MSAFLIRPGEPLPHELARIIDAQLQGARKRLATWKADPEGAFHETRRRLKKVRAAARIARTVDAASARAISADARDAARALGATRDADVVRAAAEALAARSEDEKVAATLERFARHVARTQSAAADRAAQARDALRLLSRDGGALAALAHAPERADDLKRAAKRIARRADAAFAHVLAPGDDPVDEIRHEWRKRVKDVWYAARMLRDVWPLSRPPRAEIADRLGKTLGDERDLHLLATQLRRSARACGGSDARDAALAEVEALRARKIAEAAALGRRLHKVKELESA